MHVYFTDESAHSKRFSVENFLSPFFAKKNEVWGSKQQLNVIFNFVNPKRHVLAWFHIFWVIMRFKSVERSELLSASSFLYRGFSGLAVLYFRPL